MKLESRSIADTRRECGDEQRQAHKHHGQDDLGKEALDVAFHTMKSFHHECVQLLKYEREIVGHTQARVLGVLLRLLSRELSRLGVRFSSTTAEDLVAEFTQIVAAHGVRTTLERVGFRLFCQFNKYFLFVLI